MFVSVCGCMQGRCDAYRLCMFDEGCVKSAPQHSAIDYSGIKTVIII